MTQEELLNEKERKALKLSADLWNAIVEMEDEETWHSDDIHEFRRDIHDIQNRIMARAYMALHDGIPQTESK